MVNETNDLTNSAEEAEMDYALGNSDNPLTLMVAQNKANVSLQYTTAVRSAVLDAYKEIMNLQF
ncbi:flagellar hook-basal body complex protein FliE [Lachnospiraceae bacterium KM106-2]|nr:flagellar hook-basal body complex protein FliE [Lachnospiraceae bacterium KM106-2]